MGYYYDCCRLLLPRGEDGVVSVTWPRAGRAEEEGKRGAATCDDKDKLTRGKGQKGVFPTGPPSALIVV